mmetsp:Transcript_8662/g.24654  ORF Transcript_8662/g.24654 Transcript_8662/m.24654 type:complete len:216 (+) Transcript_8662:499-1146(+)
MTGIDFVKASHSVSSSLGVPSRRKWSSASQKGLRLNPGPLAFMRGRLPSSEVLSLTLAQGPEQQHHSEPRHMRRRLVPAMTTTFRKLLDLAPSGSSSPNDGVRQCSPENGAPPSICAKEERSAHETSESWFPLDTSTLNPESISLRGIQVPRLCLKPCHMVMGPISCSTSPPSSSSSSSPSSSCSRGSPLEQGRTVRKAEFHPSPSEATMSSTTR